MKIFGIDLITGSVRSRTVQPRYALIISEDGIVSKEMTVSLHRLIQLVRRFQPDILAVDSVQEVAPHTPDIYRFLEQLPSRTRFVAVTGGERQTGLVQIASRFNITFDRFDPFAEARAIALVAYFGAGVEVVAFEKETEIAVTRNRSPGKGGWSQNRYARKIHGNVLRYAREVEHGLQTKGIQYWKKEYKAFGGVSRVIFHVREQRDQIPVSSSRGGDVQVRLSGKRLERIQYRPLSVRPKYLIVGIDPGTTIGIAVLDLNGELIRLHSSRQMTMADVIELLWSLGKPVVIASDVVPMPFTVEKIRRAFQAVPHTPRQDISVETKYELAGKFPYGNDHERDALTAALEAYRFWKHKFSIILRRAPPGVDLDEVKAGIIRGQSLEQILSAGKDTRIKTEEKKPEIILDSSDERVRILDGKVKDLRELVADLQKETEELKRQNRRLLGRISALKAERESGINKEPEIIRRDQIIANLKVRLRHEERNNKKLQRRLKRIKETKEEGRPLGTRMMKVLPDLSRESVRLLSDRMGIQAGDVLYVTSLSSWGKGIIHEITKYGIYAVVINEKIVESISHELRDVFYQEELPLVCSRDLQVQVKGEIGSCDEERLEDAIETWNDELAEFRRGKGEEMLNGLMKEYLAERERHGR
ncbi:MAG: DUF460 domain-containing protein [Methanospirillum sp.]|nr:DUF460 domain-containing protein [Methanospirillum sp.]